MHPSRQAPPPLEAVRTSLEKLRHPTNADTPPALILSALSSRHRGRLGEALAWLAAYDPAARIREDAAALLFAVTEEPLLPRSVRERVLPRAAKWILRALRDPGLDDERKYDIGPLLSRCGVELSPTDYAACFRDFDSVAARKTREHLAHMPDTHEMVLGTLAHYGAGRADGSSVDEKRLVEMFSAATILADHNPSLAASLLCCGAAVGHGAGVAPDACGRALELAARTRTARAAWLLAELARWPAGGALGSRADERARDLAADSISPRAPRSGAFSHGLVSQVDCQGAQMLALFFRTGDGGLDSVTIGLGPSGITACACVLGDGATVDEMLRQKSGMIVAPCDLDHARAIVGDALASHAGLGRPLPGIFLAVRPFLGEAPLDARERFPDLGPFLLETIVRGPELVDGSRQLAFTPPYDALWFASDRAHEWVAERRPRNARRWQPAPALVAEFARDVPGVERSAFARRLAQTLELAALGGLARRPIHRLAARTWLALVEGVVDFERIDYVRALCERSIAALADNLREGHPDQRHADDAVVPLWRVFRGI